MSTTNVALIAEARRLRGAIDHRDVVRLADALEAAETEHDCAVCDCHTWPTAKEMHDYCVALEHRLRAAETECNHLDNLLFNCNTATEMAFGLRKGKIMNLAPDKAIKQLAEERDILVRGLEEAMELVAASGNNRLGEWPLELRAALALVETSRDVV